MQIIKKIDSLLDAITMYRLLLYYLIFLVVVASIYSVFGLLPFGPIQLIGSALILTLVCYVTNKIFEKVFRVQANVESMYITALILTLIVSPIKDFTFPNLLFLGLVGTLAMVSKYIVNIKGKHIFNPTAIAVFIVGITIGRYASWWVGTRYMFPFLLLGILIVRKIRRFHLVLYFFATSIVTILLLSFLRGNTDIVRTLRLTFFDSPILFFSFIMLTEPLTTPPSAYLQSLYGGLIGILFAPIHIGVFFTTPEIALLLGNVFSYIVSPKQKLTLILKEKLKLTPDTYDFVFTSHEKLKFKAGQYLAWTLKSERADSRGNRRYFTVASSPTEEELRVGIKFPETNASSFKREMLDMKLGSLVMGGELSGDFTLPKDANTKLVFIAGGIGITPFRSIIKSLIDTNEKRDIVLIYNEKNLKQMVYKDVFDEAARKLGIKIIYHETEKEGHIEADYIQKKIPDFKSRTFYLSGPHGMVLGFEEMLSNLKLPREKIRVDYFPGF